METQQSAIVLLLGSCFILFYFLRLDVRQQQPEVHAGPIAHISPVFPLPPKVVRLVLLCDLRMHVDMDHIQNLLLIT